LTAARILIVDGDAETRARLSDALVASGRTVLSASRGEEGLDRLQANPIDIVLVDLELPDVSGLELLDAIKRASPQTEVILVTALASMETAIQAVNRAAFAYLTKPLEIEHLVATVRRAEEKQELMRARQESEGLYRFVIEHVHDAVFLVDPEGRLTFVNRGVEELTGYRRDELVGRSMSIILTPEGAQTSAARSEGAHAAGDRPFSYETELVRRDGTTVWVEVSATSVLRADGIGARLRVARDITQRRQVQAALRESEAQFRTTFEQAPAGMGHAALDGRWMRVNRRLCDIVGYAREELLARTLDDITHPDDLDPAARRLLLAGEIRTLSREQRCRHEDGSVVWIDLTLSIFRGPSGAPRCFIAVVQDVTARKKLEQELFHSQRMEGVGQLAGGIAHDFNNLLTVIGGRSQFALAQLQPADPLRRELDLIKTTADRAAALARQLLAFSRTQALQPRVVDPNDVINGSLDLLRRLIGSDIDLAFVPGSDLGRVRIDPGQLDQVIVNLIVNARDAMPRGGRLTIETSNVAVDAGVAQRRMGMTPGPHVVLAVSDTGVGMDPATRARIFEPFFTTKGPGQGTGLGLATVYGIVKQSGGHIRVYSEPGVGTVFRICLPRTEAAVDAEPSADPGPSRGTETILLVENEVDVREMVRDVLPPLGYTLLEAVDADDALLIAGRHVGLIDLLLTDVLMPSRSGRSVAEAITTARPETKVLFMSGYTGEAIVRRGVLPAGIQFLERPFSREALAAKVRAVLDRPD
jgi:two-component system cell cycle sensor histidine kinase/response regulator CckA